MSRDEDIIAMVYSVFETEPRPEHFTNYLHCYECAEHDELLRRRDKNSLGIEDVNNQGWDPICFITAEGWRYYLPALVRLALESGKTEDDWYLPQFLFHLVGDGKENRRIKNCSDSQRKAIATFLWYIVGTEANLIARYNIDNDLQMAIEIWSESPA